MPVRSSKQRTVAGREIRCNTVKVKFSTAKEPAKLQAELGELAREIVSSLSTLEPARGKALLDSFVSELYLSVAKRELSAMRRQRQAEGIAEAKTRGVRLGREPMSLPEGFEELAEEWQNGRVSAAEAGRMLGISGHTFKRRAVEWVKSAEAETDALKETDYASNFDQAG